MLWKNLKLRKQLLLCLLLCLFLPQAFLHASSLANSTTQMQQIDLQEFLTSDKELPQTSTKNSNTESKSSTTIESNSQESEPVSTTASSLLNKQDQLLKSLEDQWMQLEQQVAVLEKRYENSNKYNQKLQTMLSDSKQTIEDLNKNLEAYRAALVSNKDDTSYIVGLFAEAQAEIASLTEYVRVCENGVRKLKNARIASLSFTATGVGLFIINNTGLVKDPDLKKVLNGVAGGLTAAGGLTFSITIFF